MFAACEMSPVRVIRTPSGKVLLRSSLITALMPVATCIEKTGGPSSTRMPTPAASSSPLVVPLPGVLSGSWPVAVRISPAMSGVPAAAKIVFTAISTKSPGAIGAKVQMPVAGSKPAGPPRKPTPRPGVSRTEPPAASGPSLVTRTSRSRSVPAAISSSSVSRMSESDRSAAGASSLKTMASAAFWVALMVPAVVAVRVTV